MKNLLIGLAASFAAAVTQASTISFNNNSGSYSADGVTATVTVTTSPSGGGLYYNSVENAIGVGTNDVNGAMGFRRLIVLIPEFTEAETMTVTFSQEVVLNTIFFRQWENNVLGFGDEVHFDYSGGASGSGTVTFSDSGLGDGPLLDPFTVGLSLTSFTLRPEQDGSQTAVYLHSVEFAVPMIPEVPLPTAAWLFGSALLGLVAIGRRRHQVA